MKIKTVLFDLDGTLLPMDQDAFTKGYFRLLAAKVAHRGYEPKALVDGVWAGTAAMVANDGSCTNEEAFWKRFASIFGERVYTDKPLFDEFYRVDFQQARAFCGYNPDAAWALARIREHGCRVALATNPLFPSFATESRICWAGLEPEDFELFTTYENSRHCKPNPDYYRDVIEALGVRAEDCLMVGNDADEDMIAETLGMQTFLLTDCLINKKDRDINAWPHGGFAELVKYVCGPMRYR